MLNDNNNAKKWNVAQFEVSVPQHSYSQYDEFLVFMQPGQGAPTLRLTPTESVRLGKALITAGEEMANRAAKRGKDVQ